LNPCAQALNREVAAQALIALQFDSERQNGVDLRHHQLARQAEDGNSRGQHSSRCRVSFKYRDLVAHLRQVMRHGQAGDARAHHGDAFIVAAARRQHLLIAAFAVAAEISALRTKLAGDEALQSANGTGLSRLPRRQFASHGAPHTRPQIEANGLVARAMRYASSSRPSAIAFTYPHASVCTGQASWHLTISIQ
jgi:hypothetical protein